MKPRESFVGQPIRSLQTMLRTIAQLEPNQPSVIPDGVYTKQTADSVSAFQRRKGLPVTGVVDNTTWDRIVQDFNRANIEQQPAQPVQITLNPGQVIRKGEENVLLFLIQSMLLVLSMAQKGIPEPEITGILDPLTQEALLAFQIISDLPPTGELDKQTWKHLALQFSRAADQILNELD